MQLYICLQEIHFNYKYRYRLEENLIKIYHDETNQKKAGVAVLILDTVSRVREKVIKDKKGITENKGVNSSRRHSNS